ncbi:glutamate dehydrogenase [Neptunitalea chrysea]|uniref:Glutamate dehydrogenase n=1 Tax=Neptunitalea chrysea TaxID=1647581 RepID=A0A9W6EVM2_9FLAO|nr:glutamate dehydrogenase [Neptunitalea chrysea]GLB52672.1 glutamate dehydrogenase [Neptunitalea chrysea]
MFSQFSHEIGIIAGPTAFQSDYGEDKNFDNIKGNIGYSVGIVHYMNLALNSDCDCFNRYTYFNDHFMIRNELVYMNVTLDHFGKWVDPSLQSEVANSLRAMHGEVNVIDFGTQLEYYPIPLREFISGNYIFVPYFAMGTQANYYFPSNYSDYGNIITQNEEVFLPKYQNGQVNNGARVAFSATANIGIKIKLTRDSDLMVDMRYQFYFSDWIEGMKPDPSIYTENQRNDSAVTLSLGYIFYL